MKCSSAGDDERRAGDAKTMMSVRLSTRTVLDDNEWLAAANLRARIAGRHCLAARRSYGIAVSHLRSMLVISLADIRAARERIAGRRPSHARR